MAESSRIYTAALLVIGDEILSGRTQDKNISQIALWLGLHGLAHQRASTVTYPWPADIAERMVTALAHLRDG